MSSACRATLSQTSTCWRNPRTFSWSSRAARSSSAWPPDRANEPIFAAADNGREMRLDWALLANAAEAPPNGLVYILGAGFDTLIRDTFPTPFGGAIVLRLLTTRLETERPHKVEVHA